MFGSSQCYARAYRSSEFGHGEQVQGCGGLDDAVSIESECDTGGWGNILVFSSTSPASALSKSTGPPWLSYKTSSALHAARKSAGSLRSLTVLASSASRATLPCSVSRGRGEDVVMVR